MPVAGYLLSAAVDFGIIHNLTERLVHGNIPLAASCNGMLLTNGVAIITRLGGAHSLQTAKARAKIS